MMDDSTRFRMPSTAIGRAAILALFIPPAASCDGGLGAIGESRPVTLPLATFDGAPVPAVIGPMPTRHGEASPCRSVATGGTLALDPASGRFSLHHSIRNSCTGAIYFEPEARGSFVLEDDRLVFGPGTSWEFSGEPMGSRVIVRDDEMRLLEFGGPADASRPEVGRFRLERTDPGPLPATLPEEARPACPPEAGHGTLTLRADGTFDLEYSLVRSCTGETVQGWPAMHGSWERIAGLALLDPDGVGYTLRAEFREHEVRLTFPTEVTLIFER